MPLAVSCGFAALLLLAPAAQARPAASLTLNVTFFANGAISVTLPNGTPVGSTSGPPTVIPAGFYAVALAGPMGLPQGLPYFHLTGPAVDLLANMNEGGIESLTDRANFLPSSTYSWTDDDFPGVVHTFVTTADVEGTAPAPASSGKSSTAASQDVVGSAVIPAPKQLTGTVDAAGKPALAFDGKSVTSLKEGRYRISVTDRSARGGFTLEQGQRTVSLTGEKFVGKRSATITLTSGRWSFTTQPTGRKRFFLVTSRT
jgi:hypothetical protein